MFAAAYAALDNGSENHTFEAEVQRSDTLKANQILDAAEDGSQVTAPTDNTKSYKRRISQNAGERESWEESTAVTTSGTKEVLEEYDVPLPNGETSTLTYALKMLLLSK